MNKFVAFTITALLGAVVALVVCAPEGYAHPATHSLQEAAGDNDVGQVRSLPKYCADPYASVLGISVEQVQSHATDNADPNALDLGTRTDTLDPSLMGKYDADPDVVKILKTIQRLIEYLVQKDIQAKKFNHLECLSISSTIFNQECEYKARVKGPEITNYIQPLIAEADGVTPLHRAAMHGTPDKIRALLADGADPNARDNYGYTPMHWVWIVVAIAEAARHSPPQDDNICIYKSFTSTFLTESEDPSWWQQLNTLSRRLYSAAVVQAIAHIILFLWTHEPPEEKFSTISQEYSEISQEIDRQIKLLIDRQTYILSVLLSDKGADPNVRAKDGTTPLSWACKYGNDNIIETLRDAVGDPDIAECDKKGEVSP